MKKSKMPDKCVKRTIKTTDGKKFEMTIMYSKKSDVDKIVKLWSKKTYKEIKKVFQG
jgi:hypothetical protein